MASLLIYRAVTSIHFGSGAANGSIDLPVAREAHTGFPVGNASSVKGALRSFYEEIIKADKEVTNADKEVTNAYEKVTNALFGPKAGGGDMKAGDLMFSDLRILALPVRDLLGSYKLVTCPYVLKRFWEDRQRHGLAGLQEFKASSLDVTGQEALVYAGRHGSDVHLEEYIFRCKKKDFKDLSPLFALPASATPWKEERQEFGLDFADLAERLVVITDEYFIWLCDYAVPVNARNVLSPDKISENLWYEEVLPPETLFYGIIAARPGARGDTQTLTHKMLEPGSTAPDGSARVDTQTLTEKMLEKGFLRMGGNETIGQGWFQVLNPGQKTAIGGGAQ